MNGKLKTLAVAFMAFVAVPLLAQQGNPPASTPATPGQASPSTSVASAAPEGVSPANVVGTITTLTANRVTLNVEGAADPTSAAAAEVVGRNVEFILDPSTDRPAVLKAGDRVDLWFSGNDGERHAVRIALTAPANSDQGPATAPAEPASTAPAQPAAEEAKPSGQAKAVDESKPSDQAKPIEVVGTVASLAADRVDLKVEKTLGASAESAAGLVGTTVSFTIDATTEKPADLKAGDRVNVWFTGQGGERHAVRITVAPVESGSLHAARKHRVAAVAAKTGKPGGPTAVEARSHKAVTPAAAATASATTPGVPAGKVEAVGVPGLPNTGAAPVNGVPSPSAPIASTDASATAAAGVSSPSAPVASTDASATAAAGDEGEAVNGVTSSPAPRIHPEDPLPFIWLGAAAAAAALVLLYFTLRVKHVDLGIGSGPEGLR